MSRATIVQLDPPIPMTCKHPRTGEPDGFEAQFLIDRGLERYTYFLGPLDSDGTYWELDNTEVRACKNITVGRTFETEKP